MCLPFVTPSYPCLSSFGVQTTHRGSESLGIILGLLQQMSLTVGHHNRVLQQQRVVLGAHAVPSLAVDQPHLLRRGRIKMEQNKRRGQSKTKAHNKTTLKTALSQILTLKPSSLVLHTCTDIFSGIQSLCCREKSKASNCLHTSNHKSNQIRA